ncbi:MAG TPA: hypothetical protein VK439_09510 [Rubrivivax sp.]|nr:hypothetical protein [Rubrivivax sp.]
MSMFWLALALIGTSAVAARETAAPAAAASAAAIEQLRQGWQVLHCGVARGVLYVTYADRGQAAIAPAVANAAIAKACADAGSPIPSGAGRRGGLAPTQPETPSSARRQHRPPPLANRSEPSFTPQALGNNLSIDARNDSDIAWRCSVNFSWTSDDDLAPRNATAQATLPPRQNNRVADLSGVGRNLRFVGAPSWFCLPTE